MTPATPPRTAARVPSEHWFLTRAAAIEAATRPGAYNEATRAVDRPEFGIDGAVIWLRPRPEMTCPVWVRLRMAHDIFALLAARPEGEREADGASFGHDDLMARDWQPQQIWAEGQPAFHAALMHVHVLRRSGAPSGSAPRDRAKITADEDHQRQFSGFGATAALCAITIISGAIGITLTAIATLI